MEAVHYGIWWGDGPPNTSINHNIKINKHLKVRAPIIEYSFPLYLFLNFKIKIITLITNKLITVNHFRLSLYFFLKIKRWEGVKDK